MKLHHPYDGDLEARIVFQAAILLLALLSSLFLAQNSCHQSTSQVTDTEASTLSTSQPNTG